MINSASVNTRAIKPLQTRRRILVIDDHAMVREGLCELIGREPDLEICGQTGDAFAALKLSASTKPDLALVDLMITGKNGLELIKDLHAQQPQVSILALSMYDEMLYAERVLRAGGRGYIMKQEGGRRLMTAIRHVLAGHIAVSSSVTAKALNALSRAQPAVSPIERLSDRELEVFRLIGRGGENSAIADQLRISRKTVEAHRAHIKDKLQIATSAELISFAARWIE